MQLGQGERDPKDKKKGFFSFLESAGKERKKPVILKLEKKKKKRGRMKREREGGAKVENLCLPRAATAAHVIRTYVVGLSYYYL